MTDAIASQGIALKGEAREVALAEAQTVHSLARDDTMRSRSSSQRWTMATSAATRSSSSSRCSSSVCRRAAFAPTTGRVVSRPHSPRFVARGRVRSDSAREVSKALAALSGSTIDAVKIAAVAPGAFTLSIEAGGVQASVRLDGNGARLTSLAT
jgi:hypothetical protein